MPREAQDFDRLVQTLEATLDRFKQSGSIRLVDCPTARVEKDGKAKNARDVIRFSLPKADKAKEIRAAWEDDRRTLPCSGIIFPDESVMTVLFVCKSVPIPKQLVTIEKDIQIIGHDGIIGYVDQYSYCFFPNSKDADEIGYFRYDFHYESMGDGDLGDHTYFHFHRISDGGFRHATGPMFEFDKVVSGLESVLAPKERKKRLQKTFLAGEFKKLLFDLTVDGVLQLHTELKEEKIITRDFKHDAAFEAFMEKSL